jgi:hypothetical protein
MNPFGSAAQVLETVNAGNAAFKNLNAPRATSDSRVGHELISAFH